MEHASPRRDLRFWAMLAGFGVAGFVLRAWLAVRWETVHRPDEVFQNVEPAWRMLTGWGVVTWEWREGIRSWLFPDFIYLVMKAAALLHVPARAALPVVWAVLSAVSCGVIVVGVALGWRRQGWLGAALCGLMTAFWPDLVFFGPKTLGEVQAGNLLVIAAGLALLTRRGVGAMAATGALLGLAFDLRFQLALPLLVVAAGAGGLSARRWLVLAAGAGVVVLGAGALDWMDWGSPFQSVWKNVLVNLVQHKADEYGTQPFYAYAAQFVSIYGAMAIGLALLFLYGAAEAPWLAAVTVVTIGFHSLVAHKEISFIYAALPPAVITIGLGLAKLVNAVPRMFAAPMPARRAGAWALIGTAAVLLLTGLAEHPFTPTARQASLSSAWAAARASADLCGLGIYAPGDPLWSSTPGYSGLRRAVPIYVIDSPAALLEAGGAFNYVVAQEFYGDALAGFSKRSCARGYCLFRRAGACIPAPGFEISRQLERLGQ